MLRPACERSIAPCPKKSIVSSTDQLADLLFTPSQDGNEMERGHLA